MTSLTRNIGLRIDDNLTSNARFNLNRIDSTIGSLWSFRTDGTVRYRSKADIIFTTNDASLGGSGTGGNVQFGEVGTPLDSFVVYSSNFDVTAFSIKDTADPTYSLNFAYDSTAEGGSPDTASRTLTFDVCGADRTVFFCYNGEVVIEDAAQTLTNKTISGSSNTLSNIGYSSLILSNSIVNADINASAAIAYSKLNLSLSIVNADISNSAAIAYSKLNLTGQIVDADINAAAAISYSKLNLSGSIVNADISNSAAIDYSKLNLSGSITNSDISPTAAIDYDKLELTDSIVNADIDSAAAIDGTKIDPDFGSQNVETEGTITGRTLITEDGSHFVSLKPSPSATENLDVVFPVDTGNAGQVLAGNGSGGLYWANVITDPLPENNIDIGDSGDNRDQVDTSTLGDILADTTTGLTIKSTKFASSEPGAVSSSTSGAVGVSEQIARQDHSHDLGTHAHTGATDGGQISHTALSAIGSNTHAQIDTFISQHSPTQILTVSSSGAMYTTITAALAAITDASPTKQYIILVGPGIYIENLTAKAWVHIIGTGTGPSAPLLVGKISSSGFSAGELCSFNRFGQSYTVVSDGEIINDWQSPVAVNDFFLMITCSSDYTFTGIKQDCSGITTNAVPFYTGNIIITNTFDGSTKDIIAIEQTGSGYGSLIYNVNIQINVLASSGTVIGHKVSNSSAAILDASKNVITINNPKAASTATLCARRTTTASTGFRIGSDETLRITGYGTGVGSCLNAASSANFNHSGCNIFMDPTITGYVTQTASTDNQKMWLNSSNRDLGVTGAGVAIVTPYAEAKSGFVSWASSGPYWSRSTTTFNLLVGGAGVIKGSPVVWTAPQNVTLTTEATNYIYIDSSGVIGVTTSADEALFSDSIVLFECWVDDADQDITVKENHPYKFTTAISHAWHRLFGVLLEGAGASMVALAPLSSRTIEINGDDVLTDHGLDTSIPDSGGAAVTWNIVYTKAGGKLKRHSQATALPVLYNNAGTPSATTDRLVYRMGVSKDSLNSSTPTYIALMHNATYGNLAAAQAAIANGQIQAFPTELKNLELVQLGYVIIRGSTSAIEQVIVEKQTFTARFLGSSPASSASLISTTTTNFNGVLSGVDTTVQQALETLDDMASNAAFIEGAQDAVGAMIADSNTVDLTYTDGTPALKADVRYQDTNTVDLADDASGLKATVRYQDTNSIDLSDDASGLKADLRTQNTAEITLAVDASGLKATLGTVPYTKGGTGLTALGSPLQVLRTNAGASAIEWATAGGDVSSSVSSSVDNSIVRFDSTTGKLVQANYTSGKEPIITDAGIVQVNNDTDAVSTTDGSLQTDGGLSVVKSVYCGATGTFVTKVVSPLIKAYDANGVKFQASGTTTELGSITDAGVFTLGPASTTGVYSAVVNGRLKVTSSEDITPDSSGNGHIQISGNAYSGFISLNGTGMWIGHNSSGRDLIFAIDETSNGELNRTGAWKLGPASEYGFAMSDGSTGISNLISQLSANCYPSACVDARSTDTRAGGAVVCVAVSDDTGNAIQFHVNQDGDAVDATADLAGAILPTTQWLIGNTTTDVTHLIRNTSTGSPALNVRNHNTTSSSDGAEVLYITKGSTTNTTAQSFVRFLINAGATASGGICANGANTATFFTTSDRRVKKNIVTLPEGELYKICALRPCQFEYIEGGEQIGFIAQEMEQVYPDSVNYTGEERTELKTIVGWSKTEARMVKAIQELKAQLDAERVRNDALEARIAALENK